MHQSVNSLLVDTYIFQVDIKYDNVIAVTILGSRDNEIIPEQSVQTLCWLFWKDMQTLL